MNNLPWNRVRPALAGLARTIGAVAIAYAFFLVLMMASLQNGVAERLGKLQPAQDYSGGYSMWQQSLKAEADLASLRRERRLVNTARDEAEQKLEQENQTYLVAEAPMRALHRPLSRVTDCEFNSVPELGKGGLTESINHMRQCLALPGIPASVRTDLERFLATSGNLEASETKWLAANRQLILANARLERLNGEIKGSQTTVTKFQAVRDSFGELEALANGRMLGASYISDFSPVMTQIILVFVSGLFGALLITLVLIVYPNTKLTLSSPGTDYGARILLGGLIAVCVFVVIGGGTAVLGTSDPIAEGDINFLAFCSIGILAGMFSDRVANWLSDRANNFFTRKQNAGKSSAPRATRSKAGSRSKRVGP